MAQRRILICDDDAAMRERLTGILKQDYRVASVESGEAALEVLAEQEFGLVLLDVTLPGISGFDLLNILKENYPLVECIVISTISHIETAVQAIKRGAFHYITKDFDEEQLRSLVVLAFERQDLNRQVMALSDQVAEQGDREFLLGPNRQVRDIVDLVNKVAKLSATVLILGESGTGKELLARMLHKASGRGTAPFIAVNMSAIPHELVESTLFGHERGAFTGAHRQQIGKFELAAGGTLFLDEIGDLRLDLQAKLLRAIQEGEIERVGGAKPIKTDFRLVAATNIDLERAVKDGKFREDLYYRVNVIPIRMPPLRERMEDLPDLVKLFVARYKTKFHKPVRGVSGAALKILSSYWWPGNIRELENLVERLVAVSDKEWITEEDLPLDYHFGKMDASAPADGARLQQAVDTFERNFLIRALERCDWNVTATARFLGIPLSTLKHKMGRLEVRDLARKLRGN